MYLIDKDGNKIENFTEYMGGGHHDDDSDTDSDSDSEVEYMTRNKSPNKSKSKMSMINIIIFVTIVAIITYFIYQYTIADAPVGYNPSDTLLGPRSNFPRQNFGYEVM